MTHATRIVLASLLALFLPAATCGDPYAGDVSSYGCPRDQTCSDKIPNGLHFKGAFLDDFLLDDLFGKDRVIPANAVGGVQTVALELDHGARFGLRFGADVDRGDLVVSSQSGNRLELAGVREGFGKLRILDPGDGNALFDQVTVVSRPVGKFALARSLGELGSGNLNAPVLYASPAPLVVGIEAADGERLVDEGMQISGAGVEQIEWDTAWVALPPGTHTVTATAGGVTGTLTFEVARGPDRLTRIFKEETELDVGIGRDLCFGSFLGTRFIHSPWTFALANARAGHAAGE